MTEMAEQMGLRIVALLLIVAAASVVALWTINTAAVSGESVFAVYLSVDLVSFAMIAYIYRVTKAGDGIGRIPMAAGCALLLLLVVAGFLA